MANLESHSHSFLLIAPPFLERISADEMEIVHGDVVFIHLLWVIAMRHKEDVPLDILLHHKPRTTTKAESLALTDGIVPAPDGKASTQALIL